VYTAPVEFVIRPVIILKTLSKVESFQNDTVSLVVETPKLHRFKKRSGVKWLACEVLFSKRFPGNETVSVRNRVRLNKALGDLVQDL